MALPTVKIELDTNQPTGTPDWQDVTAYCRGWSTQRGRQYERDRVQAGTATFTLDNRDRRFDPSYTYGPYYGSLKPLRRVRISATWSGVVWDVFTGYVDRWPLGYPEGLDATVEVQATDGLMVLEGKKLSASYSAERTDVRIGHILDAASWTTGASWVLDSATNSQLGTTTVLGPVGDRVLDEGNSTMQEQTLEDVSALEHLSAVQDVENGLVYVDPSGVIVFKSRGHIIRGRVSSSSATLGDAYGELPYSAITFSEDLDHVYNEIKVTRTGADPQSASDAASQADYFVRSLAIEVPLDHANGVAAADSEALAAAQWLLSRYKDSRMRIASVTLQGQANDLLWPMVLGRDIGDVVTVTRRPPGPGGWPLDSGYYFDDGKTLDEPDIFTSLVALQAVVHRFVPGLWETEWQLAPQDTTVYWILNDPVASVLGVTTTLAY